VAVLFEVLEERTAYFPRMHLFIVSASPGLALLAGAERLAGAALLDGEAILDVKAFSELIPN
jgi:hypothetical protein